MAYFASHRVASVPVLGKTANFNVAVLKHALYIIRVFKRKHAPLPWIAGSSHRRFNDPRSPPDCPSQRRPWQQLARHSSHDSNPNRLILICLLSAACNASLPIRISYKEKVSIIILGFLWYGSIDICAVSFEATPRSYQFCWARTVL